MQNEQTLEHTSVQWVYESTDQNTCSYVNKNTTIFEVLVCIIYLLFNLVFSKVLLCSRTRATDCHRTTGTTRLDNMLKFFQLINSIDISLGTNRETTPPILMPNQCCISSRLFFTVTHPDQCYSTGSQDPSTSGSTPPVLKLQRSPTQKLLEHSSVDNCNFSAL